MLRWCLAAAAVTVLASSAIAGTDVPEAGTEAPTSIVQAVALAALAESAPEQTATLPAMIARVDLSDQMMRVYVDDVLTYTFVVSTGRGRHITPVGRYQAEWLSPKHRSRKYNNAPMPWSVFFHDGYAVHGTTEVAKLGEPASHGCVRLAPENAKLFYALVKELGLDNTLITIVR